MIKIKKNIRWIAFLSLTFVLLNIDLWKAQDPIEIFRDPDEAWYGISLKQIPLSGCQGLPVSYLFSDRPNFHSCEWTSALLKSLPVSDTLDQVSFLKLSSRFILIGVLALFTRFVFGNFLLGVLLALTLFLDGGIFFFKPGILTGLHLWRHELDEFTRMNRLISPMQYQIPLVLWCLILTSWFVSLLRGSLSRRRQYFFVVSLGLLSFPVALTPFYAWVSYFLVAFWLVVLGWILRPERKWWIPTGMTLGTMGLALGFGLLKLKIPFASEVLPRSGFYSHQWAPLFLGDKGLIVALLGVGFLLWKVLRNSKLVVLIPLSFYLLMNLNFLTGREFQNFHFKDYMAVIWWVTFICLAVLFFKRDQKVVKGFLVFLITLGGFQHVRSQMERPSFFKAELERPDTKEILEYTKNLPSQTKLFCGLFYQILPLKTAVRCSWHHLLMTYPLSNQELLRQSLANWRLSGLSREEVQARISQDADPQRGLGVWSFGARPEWLEGTAEVELYSVENLRDKIIPLWMKEYDLMTQEEAAEIVGGSFYILKNSEVNEFWTAKKTFSVYGIYQRTR